jgi:hypothetical protein
VEHGEPYWLLENPHGASFYRLCQGTNSVVPLNEERLLLGFSP